MIAHVAEASEHSGRVVLWLDPASGCTRALLETPIRLAAAYRAEVETVTVAELQEADVPIRRIGDGERDRRTPEHADTLIGDQRFALLTERYRRLVDETGNHHGVRVRHTAANGDAVDQISELCLSRGPWNIV